MKSHLRTLAPVLVSLFLITAGAAWLNAQITNAIRAHIDHSFVIGNTTLPPGDYTFRVRQDSDLSVMTASSEDNKTVVDFIVGETIDDHTPNHSVLVFRRFGNTEFLNKVYEAGSKVGVQVRETSRQEARFVSQGQQAMEHSEEQK